MHLPSYHMISNHGIAEATITIGTYVVGLYAFIGVVMVAMLLLALCVWFGFVALEWITKTLPKMQALSKWKKHLIGFCFFSTYIFLLMSQH